MICLGSVFLEIGAAREVFKHLLSNLPAVDLNLTSFVQYLRNFWLPKLDKVCCWDENLPRTNNPAETFHSVLSSLFKR